MSPQIRRRLPFALLTGVIIFVGFRVADSSPWLLALFGVAAVLVAAAPDILEWRRTRRSSGGQERHVGNDGRL